MQTLSYFETTQILYSESKAITKCKHNNKSVKIRISSEHEYRNQKFKKKNSKNTVCNIR